MTERNMGANFSWFVGKVVNRKDDPQQAGRIQIRVYGIHDNVNDVPDSDLPWAYTLMPATSASYEHTGSSPTGILEDSTVVGFFVDREKQIPIVMGTIHRSSINPSGSSTGATYA